MCYLKHEVTVETPASLRAALAFCTHMVLKATHTLGIGLQQQLTHPGQHLTPKLPTLEVGLEGVQQQGTPTTTTQIMMSVVCVLAPIT